MKEPSYQGVCGIDDFKNLTTLPLFTSHSLLALDLPWSLTNFLTLAFSIWSGLYKIQVTANPQCEARSAAFCRMQGYFFALPSLTAEMQIPPPPSIPVTLLHQALTHCMYTKAGICTHTGVPFLLSDLLLSPHTPTQLALLNEQVVLMSNLPVFTHCSLFKSTINICDEKIQR